MTRSVPTLGESPLHPDLLMHAYRIGIFPMAERRDGPIEWFKPHRRGVLLLDNLRISRSLRKTLERGRFAITYDRCFAEVIAACAERDETWISPAIQESYVKLHATGYAHSVEVWDGTELAGGLYGVCVGAIFAGESMFSRRTDASKVGLALLVQQLRRRGFVLIDCQYLTPHIASLGGQEITSGEYRDMLDLYAEREVTFSDEAPGVGGSLEWDSDANGAARE